MNKSQDIHSKTLFLDSLIFCSINKYMIKIVI